MSHPDPQNTEKEVWEKAVRIMKFYIQGKLYEDGHYAVAELVKKYPLVPFPDVLS